MDIQSITSPVAYPTIEISGRSYVLKMTMGGVLRLERSGIDVAGLRDATWNADLTFRVLAALAGTETQDGTFQPIGLTAEQLADRFTIQQFTELASAVRKALVKAPPADQQAQAQPAESASQPETRTATG